MYITAISVCSEGSDRYAFIVKSREKLSNKKIEKYLKEEENFYLDYDEPSPDDIDSGEIEIGWIDNVIVVNIKDIEEYKG